MKNKKIKQIVRKALLNEMYGWSSLQTKSEAKSILSSIIMDALHRTEAYFEKYDNDNEKNHKSYSDIYEERNNIIKVIRLLEQARIIVYEQM